MEGIQMITPKEIFNAMSALRQTCEEAESCIACPLYSEEKRRCILRIAAPNEWRLNPAVENIWRAVK
jgi:hypothetical protein